MAEPLRNPEMLQRQLSEFQDVQRQLQMIAAQKQQIALQLEEAKIAQEEVDKSTKGIYRSVGPLLLEATKADASNDLKERKEFLEVRLNQLEKQEGKVKPRFEELRAALEKLLSPSRGPSK
jgi:prefoldin beta subunit